MNQALIGMNPRTFTALCAEYDKQVRKLAINALLAHGYYGLDPREDAPSSYDAIVRAVECEDRTRNAALFPVYNLGCENTVFTNAVGNLLFRAWHDLCHYNLGAGLDYQGEHAVALHQASFFVGEYRDICIADTIGQLNFFEFTKGGFVTNQKQFVYDCLTLGQERAIVKHEWLDRQAA